VTSPAPAPRRTSRWGEPERLRERELLAALADLAVEDPRRSAVRDELVTMHLPLVRHLARRYRDRGESTDDLVQVGTVGLIKAVDRFDLSRGVEFSTFATPTILGEIKRHFRDRTWALRVPRRLQELQAQVTSRSEELTRTLHRAPTVRELAASLDVTEDEILEALEARHAYNATSLEASAGDGADGGSALADRFGELDPAFERVEYRESLRPLLDGLPERERRIVLLRFFHNMSQTQIADELGISQMHVSRLLAKALARLREGLADT
jgi:RNA polymerase sigma-B factor